jgi:hypothetical protein
LERDVTEADLPALRALRCLRRGVLADVVRVEVVANVMNTPPWSGSSSAITKPSTSR